MSPPIDFPLRRHSRGENSRRCRSRQRGLTLIEALVAMTIFGLVMAGVTRQLIEGVTLSLKTARLLEHGRNSRYVVDKLSVSVRSAQSIVIYPEFTSRSTEIASGSYGNYVVVHKVNSAGTITRTVGYYLKADSSGGTYALYCHDSDDGVLSPGALPGTGTSGSHTLISRTVRLPSDSGVKLFRNWRNLGFTLRGQFGTADGSASGRVEYLQCTLTTLS